MSNIEWTDTTWNPVVGCTPVSPGCLNCYAAQLAGTRLANIPSQRESYAGLTVLRDGRQVFNGSVRCLPERLAEPLKWRKPRMVFVNSMSDLFHEAVPFEFIDRVFAVMALCPQHTFQVLTKRPERMAEYMTDIGTHERVQIAAQPYCKGREFDLRTWPLPNVWLGTSVEDQARADLRIPHLLRCPAAVRFLSCEPLLGPVDLSAFFGGKYVGLPGDVVHPNYNFGIHWCIIGGESGPNARPCDVAWIRSIVRRCRDAGVPVFVKQLGAWPRELSAGNPPAPMPWVWDDGGEQIERWYKPRDRKGGEPSEWPEDLRVRQWPGAAQKGEVR